MRRGVTVWTLATAACLLVAASEMSAAAGTDLSSFDGSYVSTELVRPPGVIIEIVDTSIVVDVVDGQVTGTIVQTAITRQDNGFGCIVTQRGVETKELTGVVDAAGQLDGTGRTYVENTLLSAEPEQQCLGVTATEGPPDGVEVSLSGVVSNGVMCAEIVNSVSGASSTFEAVRAGASPTGCSGTGPAQVPATKPASGSSLPDVEEPSAERPADTADGASAVTSADAPVSASDVAEDPSDGSSLVPVVALGTAGLVAVGVGVAIKRRRGRDKAPPAPDHAEHDEERDPPVTLELTYPAGVSPLVFTEGWVFGARCIAGAGGTTRDLSGRVRWSGTGTFEPSVGAVSHPVFANEGSNSIVLSVDVDGRRVERAFPIEAVFPHGYAAVGDLSHCPSDGHGCPACPHVARGPIATGSPTVTIGGFPAARVGDTGVHQACCGPNTFTIVEGDERVLIDGRPAARLHSATRHCGGSGQIISSRGSGIGQRH